MKFKKLLAGVCAMSIAASMMAVSASAAVGSTEDKLIEPTNENLIVDGGKVLGANVAKVDLQMFAGFEADVASVTVKAIPYDGGIWGNGEGWFGGGGSIGYNSADGWVQVDYAGDGKDDVSVAWAAIAGADGGNNSDEVTFNFEIPEGTKFVYEALDEDEESETYGQIVSGGEIQFGYWWGSQNVIEITDYYITFTDGTVVGIAGKSGREQVAANALKELQDAYDKFDVDVDEVVASTTAAAEALGNTTAAVEDINAAIEKVNGLKAVLAKAQAAFDALQEGDNADTDAFKTAKAAVEKAAADLEAAQTALDKAIAAYDEKTAEEKAKLEQQIADLEAEKAKLEAELEAAKKDAAANADKIKDLEAQIAAKDKEIEELKKNPPAASGSDNSGTGSQGGSEGGSQGSTSKGDNPGTGATAGLALAGLALAGAAVVASKKRK